jgi:hypothetical protein
MTAERDTKIVDGRVDQSNGMTSDGLTASIRFRWPLPRREDVQSVRVSRPWAVGNGERVKIEAYRDSVGEPQILRVWNSQGQLVVGPVTD